MPTSDDLMEVAQRFRERAKEPGRLVDRARLIILAEEFEQFSRDAALMPSCNKPNS